MERTFPNSGRSFGGSPLGSTRKRVAVFRNPG